MWPSAPIASFDLGWDAFVALGTLGLAFFTAALAWSTRRLAAASSEDQRAQWRPVVIADRSNRVDAEITSDGQRLLVARLRNVGRGPAFAVQAELRAVGQPVGASLPNTMETLAAGDDMELVMKIRDVAPGKSSTPHGSFPPAMLQIKIAYYDVAERWHQTYLTVVRSGTNQHLRVAKVLVNESDRMLLPVHGSVRARAEEARRENRTWRRVSRAVKAWLSSVTSRDWTRLRRWGRRDR